MEARELQVLMVGTGTDGWLRSRARPKRVGQCRGRGDQLVGPGMVGRDASSPSASGMSSLAMIDAQFPPPTLLASTSDHLGRLGSDDPSAAPVHGAGKPESGPASSADLAQTG
ncbi:hypothetical protein B0T14DRAFT_531835 [Immersiella caudata]|uniref:Uncharacterized protein n=1 Tax=Immersiella caudata TaxID=314043 RepID=A0AA39U6S8_9PEZI|nr:hypothetical protein B0T14DRAFT_531835 [Immersiella caudata]